jgi:hypothetical protein
LREDREGDFLTWVSCPQEMADLSKDHNNTIFDRGRYADIEVLYFGDYDEIMEMINGLPRGGYAGIRITDSDIKRDEDGLHLMKDDNITFSGSVMTTQ